MNQGESGTRKKHDLRKLVGVLMGVSAASTAMAQTVPTNITIDSSFGRTPGQVGPSATNTTVTGNRGATYNVNNLYTIAESQGRTAGANLFHSFGTFNVGAGDAAVFTTTSPALQNIIARVSGPSASTIQGLLAVNAAADSAPNFFFINPAGVTFGAGAQVDVPAAFHVSTASELRFADGTTFKAGAGPDSSMTMAAPEAFGFIGGSGDIAFNGVHADLLEQDAFDVPEDGRAFVATSFDVTAADITFDDSAVLVPRAQVRLLGNGADAGSIAIQGMPEVAAQGDIRLTNSRLDAGSNAGTGGDSLGDAGALSLLGRNVSIDGSQLIAAIAGTNNHGAAGSIRVRASGDFTLTGATSLLAESRTPLNRNGRSGAIEVIAQGAITTSSSTTTGPRLSTRTSNGAFTQSGDGIFLQGRSVSLSNSMLDGTGAIAGASPISVVSASTIALDGTTITAETNNADRPSGSINLRSLGGGSIVARNSTITNSASNFSIAGDVLLETAGDVELFDSTVSSASIGGSVAGNLRVRSDSLTLAGNSSITAESSGGAQFFTTGGRGSIQIDATKQVVVGTDATITGSVTGRFDNPQDPAVGQISINTPQLLLAGRITTATSATIDASKITIDGGSAGLVVQGPGLITSSSTTSSGDAGAITLLGQDISVSGVQLRSTSDATSTGAAGSIQLMAANQLALSGVQLQTDTASSGIAGNIALIARSGNIDSSQISSQASAGSSGQTGTITLGASDSLRLSNSTVSVANDANAADLTMITQGKISIDAPTLTLQSTRITAESTQNVIASSIAVTALSGATFDNSSISSSARGSAAAGDIAINSNGIVTLNDSTITGEALAAKTSQLTVAGSQALLNGTSRLSTSLLGGPTTTTGGVGAVRVTGTEKIAVAAGSSIEARTVGSFDNPDQAAPGEVRLTTPRLEVDGTITTETLGNVAASNIVITANGPLAVVGTGLLTSSTSGSGNAGNIDINGTDTSITGVMINSASSSGSSGNAGTVTISAADDLAIVNSTVRTDTAGSGKAGNIALAASTISIDPSLISSQAANGSSGQTGTVDVTASKSIELRDSTVSIANAARVDDPSMTPLGRIRLSAPDVKLFDSNVTAQSSENIAASAISIASDKLMIRRSNVTTSAQEGNGGNIDVVGQRFTVLDKSQISTSVLGSQSGSGGDISVRANVLVVSNGFIQANTAAPGASGGNVTIGVGQLLPIGALVTGGDVPLVFDPLRNGLNAIQAAAPDGVSGTIQFAGPSLDVVGNLQRVEAEFVATGPLGQDLCKRGNASSLTQLGRGGLRPLSTGLLRPDTSLSLLPELPALSLRLDTQAPTSRKCGH